METILIEEKLESISEMVIKNSEDITALNFKVDDIRATMARMATKEDLKGFATKDDISRLDKKIDGIEQKLDFVVNKLS